MRRRAVQLGSVLVAVAALAVVLYNATLVDRRPPSVVRVALSAPAVGDAHVGQALTAIDVEFSEPVRTATVEQRFRIDPYVAGTFSWDGATMIYTPSQKLPGDTAFTVTVTAGYADLAGNTSSTGLDPWQFRTVGPPVLTSTAPTDGAADIPTTAKVQLTFDRLMDTASVERAISISPGAAFHASWSGQTVTLSLDAPLAFGTDYVLTVATDARDTGGTPLRESAVVRFRTVAAGLGVVSTVPAANVSGVSVRSPIAVVFDGPVDPSSIADALRITPDVGGDLRIVAPTEDVAATPSATPSGTAAGTAATPAASASPSASATGAGRTVLLLTPGAPLAAHTTYTVSLGTVVRGVSPGAGVAAGRSWTFTTGGPSQSAQNQIAFLSNRGGVRNVWLMNPDGSNQRQITTDLAPVTSFDVSATGDRLVYAAGGAVKIASIDGGDFRTLTQVGRFEYSPMFGVEARVVYLGRRAANGNDLGWWEVPLEPGAGNERQLLPDGAPPVGSFAQPGEVADPDRNDMWARRTAVSDDKRRLLVLGADLRPVLVDLAATNPQPPQSIALDAGQAPPAWDRSSDAFLVVASAPSAGAGGNPSVWRIAPDGTPTRVGPGADSAAAAADGGIATIARSVASAAGHVAYVPTRGSAARELTTAGDLSDSRPSFSPDGASILFLRVKTTDPTVSAGIWVVDPDGRELRQLSTDGADPRWLP